MINTAFKHANVGKKEMAFMDWVPSRQHPLFCIPTIQLLLIQFKYGLIDWFRLFAFCQQNLVSWSVLLLRFFFSSSSSFFLRCSSSSLKFCYIFRVFIFWVVLFRVRNWNWDWDYREVESAIFGFDGAFLKFVMIISEEHKILIFHFILCLYIN